MIGAANFSLHVDSRIIYIHYIHGKFHISRPIIFNDNHNETYN